MALVNGYQWWQTEVIYQIYPRSFRDANGDGIGDLAGIIEKLDYLSDTLGVDAVWVSPFYPSPMADFGYDVSDYTGIDPMFGDMATFDRLLAEVHARGMKLIVDIVPNHTSDQHPWFVESRSSRVNPKHDWYIWRDAKPDGSPPNNWLSDFGGPAWEWDETRQQYYLHSFLKEQPDLNWRNPAVKEAMFDVYRFWLDRGVDGFRIDVAHYIMKDPDLRDNPPNPNRAAMADIFKSMGDYDSLLHLYDKGHEDVHGVYRELRQLLDSYNGDAPRMMVGEIHIFDLQQWARYYGEQLDEMHLPFGFGLIGVPWEASRVRAWVDAVEAAVPEGGWPNYVMGNHDEHRLATRFGRTQARGAALLLLTFRGTPFIYYGDEIGMVDVEVPPEREQDPFGKRVPGLGLGRDPQRTPMQWSDAPHAGFAPPETPQTWLPISPDYREVNVERQLADPHSILNLYRRLLAYRKQSPPLLWGRYTPLDDVPHDCYAYWRDAGEQRVLVALNFTGDNREINLPQTQGRIVLSTYLDREEEVRDCLTLRGHEGVIVEAG